MQLASEVYHEWFCTYENRLMLMGHCFLYALTIQVSKYDIVFFGSPRVLMLRVIIVKKMRFFAPRRVETANQHIKKN
jgi:hypothetical protein